MPEQSNALDQIPSQKELEKLPSDGGDKWNRLVFEQSPYLLQHASNPVDWFPWGKEAFETAREQDKPIFLSVGYSTCHWCHVMEHESFEDPEIAQLMNDAFVNIKVDREERPDIDHVYMTVTQALTGSGGWPMTVIMTADKEPFFAGTYFPRESRFGRPGMRELVAHISDLWENDRSRVMEAAQQISAELPKMSGSFPGGEIGPETLKTAFSDYNGRFDPVNGGFGARPKFPVPHGLGFLLAYSSRTGNGDALTMVEKTLEQMRLGGIYDHIGFGFHRYSTDAEWLLPHFEKMLYDQAGLAAVYTEAWQASGNPLFRQTAEEILSYVQRDMTSPEGGFYSAEDADSEGEEGKFYVWTVEEVKHVLGEQEGEFYAEIYQMKEDGNFREESTGRRTGDNIPHLDKPLEEIAKERGIAMEELKNRLEKSREKLFQVREKRVHPLKDDKILTDWNGLMIAAFAKASRAFGEQSYREAAVNAADFVLEELRAEDGRLLKRYRRGEAGLPAHLEDYAFLAHGLIELYEATFDPKYLRAAVELTDYMIEHFWDEQEKAFFQTADNAEDLPVRSKDAYDGAIPSGNSMAAYNLVRLGRMTSKTDYEKHAEETMQAFSRMLEQGPSNFSQMLQALNFALGPSYEIVLAGDKASPLRQQVDSRYLPTAVLLHRPIGEDSPVLELAPFTESQKALGGKPTAYFCQNYSCQEPVTEVEEFIKILKKAESKSH